MKGIILAGGNGTRVWPLTDQVSKQMLPIVGLPMIIYPLNTLLSAGITEILVILSQQHSGQIINFIEKLALHLDISISYRVQQSPDGLPQAFVLGKNFIGNDPVMLILGDNIFEDNYTISQVAKNYAGGGHIFAKKVPDPERLGVVEFDSMGRVIGIVEKPREKISDYAIPGIYVYDPGVVAVAQNLKKSERGEYEIVDVHKKYLDDDRLAVTRLDENSLWMDAGTLHALDIASVEVKKRKMLQKMNSALIEALALSSPRGADDYKKNRIYF